ncbi:hypothetical protein IBA8401_21810 [Pseudomonas syringae]
MIAGAVGSGEAAMPEKRQGISAVEGQSGKVGAVFLPVWGQRWRISYLHYRIVVMTDTLKRTRIGNWKGASSWSTQ